MKYWYFLLFIFFVACEQSSESEEKVLKQASTIQEAYDLAGKYPFLKLRTLSNTKDTTALDKQLFKMKIGEIATIEGTSYKVIKDTGNYTLRASYIYIDGAKVKKTDSLQQLILKQYKAGTPFETLVDKYNMDGNTKHGDTGPFQAGMMVKEFEDAVRNHENGDVFTLDIPDRKWYYVVKKTAENEGETVRVVLGFKKTS